MKINYIIYSRGFLKTMLSIAINLKIWSMIDWYDPKHFFCISSESVLCRSYSVEETRGSLSRQKQKKRPQYHLSAGATRSLLHNHLYHLLISQYHLSAGATRSLLHNHLYHSIICQQEQHGLSFITTYITYLYHSIICQPEQHGLSFITLISLTYITVSSVSRSNTVSPS